MAKIVLKKSSVVSKVPLTTDLDYGEMALNYADGKLYFKNSSNVIKSFTLDDLTVTTTGTQTLTNKTIAAGSNTITGLTNTNLSGSAGITNANLANSSVTVGSTAISLGSSATTIAGLTSVTSTGFTGALTGNASTATTLQTARAIQGVNFDGSAAITVVTAGTGVTVTGTSVAIGQAVGTSSNVTFNDVTVAGNLTVSGTTTTVNSTTLDVADINITVAKNASTAAAANGAGLTVAGPATPATLTYSSADDRWNFNKSLNATLFGNVTGAVTGNASTATTLQTARAINGVNFDGSAAITVTAAAGTLTGTTLNSGVTASSLTSVGTITSGTWSGSFGAVSGANLTSLTAANLSGTIPSASMPALTGDITTTAGAVATTLATVNSNVGTYGSATLVPVVTVNAKGLVTSVTTASIASLPSQTSASGKYLTTNGSTASWDYVAATVVSATAPTSPVIGMKWLDSTTTTEFTYINDGDSSQWVELGAGGYGGYVTLTGTQTLTNKTLTAPTITGYTETVYALGTSGTQALNPANGTIQTCAAAGAVTFTDSLASGQSIVLSLTGGSTYTITWPTTTWVTATGNVAPTLSAANTLVFWKIASTLYGALVGKSA